SLLNISSNLSQPLELAISAISELGEGPLSPWLSLAKLALPPLPPRPSIQSSSDTQIVVEWSLDRGKERGAYHTGYYVYVSVDGTTWPDEDTGYIATWQDEFTTQYTMDCTLSASLGGQSRSKQFLWFKVAARSAVGRGPLSTAVARRCSGTPSAPLRNLTLNSSSFAADGIGWSLITWEEPSELHDAVLLGYQVYVDANTADAQDLYTLLDVIEDPAQRLFKHQDVVQGETALTWTPPAVRAVQWTTMKVSPAPLVVSNAEGTSQVDGTGHSAPGQSYKYKVTAVSETGEGTASVVTLVPAVVPLEPPAPVLLDDCTMAWWLAENGTTKALCSIAQRYQLAVASVDLRDSADINAPRVNPFVTVVAGTVMTVSEEVYSADGRIYLNLPDLGGWLWDDTPLDPGEGNPLAYRLPTLKFSWTWYDDEVRALGGQPLTAWHVYRSGDGVQWDAATELAASARNASYDCEVAQVGLPFWVRVAAVNSIGEGPASDALKLRCALPPGMQPAPSQLDGDLNSIIVGFDPQNLHGAELFFHRLTYALSDDLEGILAPTQLDVPGAEQRVNISGLLPFATYVVKVQAITEAGTSLDPGWQSNMSTGSVVLLPPPSYLSSDGSFLQLSLSNLSDREWPEGERPGYNVYLTADDRAWPATPWAVADSWIFEHDCSRTPDYTQLEPLLGPKGKDGNGDPAIVDQSYNFVYAMLGVNMDNGRVSLSTATGLGYWSDAATFYCSPLPAQPALEVLNSDAEQITLQWPNPELYGAPLVGYNIYMDNGMGGELTFYKHVSAQEVALDETNNTVMLSLHPLPTGRWFRVNVTVATEAGESPGQQVDALTCDAPPTPEVLRLSTSTSLILRRCRLPDRAGAPTWNASVGSPVCAVHGYEVISEVLNSSSEVNASLVLLSYSGLAPNDLEYQVDNLISEAEYRFRVVASVAYGTSASGWAVATAAGVPEKMEPVRHLLNLSFSSAIYLEWTPPNMNGGTPVGYALRRDDGPGTAWRDMDCMAVDCSSGCELHSVHRVPGATGCYVSGLQPDGLYRFAIRAVNAYGAGPLSEEALVTVGALPNVRAPQLVKASYENCTMIWEWLPAIENGKLVHSYDLQVEDANASGVAPLLITLDGNASAPVRTTTATVSSDTWRDAVPGRSYRAALRARSDEAISEWSEWSESRFCISEPGHARATGGLPNPPQRDWSVTVKAGRVQLLWDTVTAEMAGDDDLSELGVSYEIWGRPYPQGYIKEREAHVRMVRVEREEDEYSEESGTMEVLQSTLKKKPTSESWKVRSVFQVPRKGPDDRGDFGVVRETFDCGDQTSWRRLHHLMAHEGAPAVAIDTFFETAVTAVWAFKLRIGNRNGYGPFSQEVWLSTGQLPSEPVALSASVALNGQIALTWRAPVSDGYLPLTGYQDRSRVTGQRRLDRGPVKGGVEASVTDQDPTVRLIPRNLCDETVYLARCGSGGWEEVANTEFSHQTMLFSPPSGLVTCELRAVNAVGASLAAQSFVTCLAVPRRVSGGFDGRASDEGLDEAHLFAPGRTANRAPKEDRRDEVERLRADNRTLKLEQAMSKVEQLELENDQLSRQINELKAAQIYMSSALEETKLPKKARRLASEAIRKTKILVYPHRRMIAVMAREKKSVNFDEVRSVLVVPRPEYIEERRERTRSGAPHRTSGDPIAPEASAIGVNQFAEEFTITTDRSLQDGTRRPARRERCVGLETRVVLFGGGGLGGGGDAASQNESLAASKWLSSDEGATGEREGLTDMTKGVVFKSLAMIAIVANTLYLGWAADFNVKNSYRKLRQQPIEEKSTAVDWGARSEDHPVFACDGVAGWFAIEIIIRAAAEKIQFITGSDEKFWNALDVFLVTESLITLTWDFGAGSSFALLRIVRVFRLVRIVRLVRTVQVGLTEVTPLGDERGERGERGKERRGTMIFAMLNSFADLLWALQVVLLIVFVFSLIFNNAAWRALQATRGSGAKRVRSRHEFHVRKNVVESRILVGHGAVSGGNDWMFYAELLKDLSPGMGEFYFLVFNFYIAFCVVGLFNVVTGVFVDSAVCTRTEDEIVQGYLDEMKSMTESIKGFLKKADKDASGTLTYEEFQAHMSNPVVKAYFSGLDIDPDETKIIFTLLDSDCNGDIDIEEFVHGTMKLKGYATKLDVMALMYDATRQSIRFDALCEFVESRLEVEGRGTSRDRGEIEGVRRDVRRHAFVLGLEQLRKRGRCL
ncbi:Fibronectin type-III domain-containing protein 3a, partial [Durusdinium trenchii]